MKAKIVSAIAVLSMTMMSLGATNTWTGAVDGSWSNAANWDVNGIPSDSHTSAGLTLAAGDVVVFDGANAPTNGVPGIGGTWAATVANTPILQFNKGGVFNFDIVANNNGIIRNYAGTNTIWTIGDGVGAADDVTLNIRGMNFLNRHTGGSVNDFLIHSDGVLTFDGNIDFVYGGGGDRFTTFTIAGGDVVVNGIPIQLGQEAASYVDFTTTNGSFTAEFGSLLPDLVAVESSDVWKNNSGGILEFTTNGTSFTVSAVYSALIPSIDASTQVGVFPLEVVFDGSGSTPSEGIVAYNWDFGDGNTDSGSVVTNTYTTEGEYVATLTISDATSTSNSTTVSINAVGPATNIVLVADTDNSSTAFYGTSVSNLLTDTFDYNPLDPTAMLPSLLYSDGFHGNDPSGTNVISFTLSNAYTTVSTYPVIGLDLWGRNGNQERDDNIDVILYNGDYSTEVGRVEGVAIPDGLEPYARAIIDTMAIGTTFDRIQIIGHHAQFTLTEVRLAAVWGELAAVTADISVSTTSGVLPVEVVFDGSGSVVINGPATYDWDFGDGNTGIGAVVTNTYVADGAYTATLTVTDSQGSSNSATTVIEAYYMPGNVVYSTSKPATPPTVSSLDLGQTAFLSVTNTGVWDDARAYPDTALFDGAVSTTGTWFHTDASVTITFDTSAYTLGYDITQIDTVFGGNPGAGGRANQGYSVTVTYMDDSTEKILGKKTWEPNSPASYWTKVSFSNSVGGVIASGVKAVTFAEFDPAGAAASGDFTIACEFDVFGVGTEPTDGPTLGITDGSLMWTTPTVKDYDVEYREFMDHGDWGFYTNVTSTPPETSVELPMGRYDAEFFRVIESE